MGNRITEIESPQGFAAESSGAAVILASSYFGYPLSTTHVVSGGVDRAPGVGKRLDERALGRRRADGRRVGADAFRGAASSAPPRGRSPSVFGTNSAAGTVLIALLAALAAGALYMLASATRSSASDLDRTHVSPEREAETRPRQPAVPATA